MRDRICIWHTCLFLTQILLYPSAHIFADVLDLCSASTRTLGANGLSETSRLVQIYTCDIVNQTVTHKHAMSTECTHNRNWIAPCLSIGFALGSFGPLHSQLCTSRSTALLIKHGIMLISRTPRSTCRTQRDRCDLPPQKREESSGRELEEAEIIPGESLRWYLCGM